MCEIKSGEFLPAVFLPVHFFVYQSIQRQPSSLSVFIAYSASCFSFVNFWIIITTIIAEQTILIQDKIILKVFMAALLSFHRHHKCSCEHLLKFLKSYFLMCTIIYSLTPQIRNCILRFWYLCGYCEYAASYIHQKKKQEAGDLPGNKNHLKT